MSVVTRNARRISFVITVLVFILIIGFFIYILTKKDEPESTVQEDPKPANEEIVVKETKIIKNDTVYDFIAIVENPNTDWALESFSYQLLADNQKVESASGESFLGDGEEKPIIVKRLRSNEVSLDSQLELRFSDLEWKKRNVNMGKTALEVDSKEVEERFVPSGSQSLLMGEIQNKSDYDLVEIEVLIVGRDTANNIIAVNSYLLENVEQSARKSFYVTWLNSEVDSKTNFELYPSSNFYKKSNIIESAGQSRQDK